MGLKPWEADSVEPRLSLPSFEAAVGDSVALPSGGVSLVADAAVAPKGARGAALVARRPREGDSADATPTVGLARAVPVTVPAAPLPSPESGAGGEGPSAGASPVVAPPEGASPPATTPVSDGGSHPEGPITAGPGPVLESCDGDEYVITIVIDPETAEDVEAEVEIVLKRVSADGTVEELTLEGDVLDAQRLALQLSSEGNCVVLEAAAPGEEASPDGTSQAVVPSGGTSSPGLDVP
jgi:hypothetical protein